MATNTQEENMIDPTGKAELEGKRKAEKARRMLEKAMRMPVNEVCLQVADGIIPVQDLFARIDERIKEVRDGGK
jgi:hypothetical protein